MNCLLCQLNPVTQDTRAGLCLSCRWAVKRGDYRVEADHGSGRVWLIPCRADELNPLGIETDGPLPAWEWCPEDLFPDGAEPWQLAEHVADLLALALGPPVSDRAAARHLIDKLRALGFRVAFKAGLGRGEIDNPRAVPYPLLVEWVRLGEWVDTVLLGELTRAQAARERERQRALRDRYGADFEG